MWLPSRKWTSLWAQPAGDVAHEHLVGLRVVALDIDHLVAARALEQHRGA